MGLPVEVSVSCTGSGAVPVWGEAVKAAVGATGPAPPARRSACQYRLVAWLLASTTIPLVAVTDCLVAVASFMFAEAASRITGVPQPEANTGLPIGAVLS